MDGRKNHFWMDSRTWKKRPTEKTHPDLVPYDKLPDKGKNKDKEAIEDIPKGLEQVGQYIFRSNI